MIRSALLVVLFISVKLVAASTTEDKFLSSCLKYFYKDTPPTGLDASSYRYICQRYNGAFHFATLYDIKSRIPIYSAYQIEELDCVGKQPARRDKWFVEPELGGRSKPDDMMTDKKRDVSWIMVNQSINIDYKNTGFDRGHLNPNFHHCNASRTATFSLTNSVPQNPCFNRFVWYRAEGALLKDFKQNCAFSNAERYIITGVVPSLNNTIPEPDVAVEDLPDRDNSRVNVPKYMWTGACCDGSNSAGKKSYFKGWIGENEGGSKLTYFYDVAEMNERLSFLYETPVKIFAGSCTEAAVFG